MDYGSLINRAWQITWRWKVLWILGFLASLGRMWSSGNNATYTTESGDWQRLQGLQFPPELVGLLCALGCVAVILMLLVWVVSIMARGGLIAGVRDIEEEGSTTFSSAWRAGRSRFWTLLGIGVLAAIPMFILAFVLALMLAAGIAVSTQAGAGSGDLSGSWAAIVPLALCGATLCCGLILVGLVLGQIRIYAERAAIIEGLGWIDAFRRGWQVLRNNLGPTIVVWLILLVLGMIIVFMIAAVTAVLLLPMVALMGGAGFRAWAVVPLACGGLIGIVVVAVVASILETFTSALWTLAFRELSGPLPAVQPEPLAE
jgi:hypothetical protein